MCYCTFITLLLRMLYIYYKYSNTSAPPLIEVLYCFLCHHSHIIFVSDVLQPVSNNESKVFIYKSLVVKTLISNLVQTMRF